MKKDQGKDVRVQHTAKAEALRLGVFSQPVDRTAEDLV